MPTSVIQAHQPDWARLVGDSIRQNGLWHTWSKLNEARARFPQDDALVGYLEITRNAIVREFLQHPKGMQLVPRLSGEFMSNFDRFQLNAQEGYLASLIDGRLDLQKLIVLSPFDPFSTIFLFARLAHERAIIVPQ